jgi:hypothetical protein
MKLRGTDADNEKYVLIQKFHASSTAVLGIMWYCFVVGVTYFALSISTRLVGHVGRGDKATQKTENMQSNRSTVTSVAEMSAALLS